MFDWEASPMPEKYIGRPVSIIYQDRSGNITQRRIVVHAISNGRVRAYDLDKRAPRVFDAGRILAVRPVNRHVG
jgi:predicted DNA-binding transcriptional regulator YafY